MYFFLEYLLLFNMNKIDPKAIDASEIEILIKLKNGDDLPTLSPVAIKIIKLASDESSSAQDIANVITLDPA